MPTPYETAGQKFEEVQRVAISVEQFHKLRDRANRDVPAYLFVTDRPMLGTGTWIEITLCNPSNRDSAQYDVVFADDSGAKPLALLAEQVVYVNRKDAEQLSTLDAPDIDVGFPRFPGRFA